MKDLTQGNIYKTYLLFAIPLVLAGLFTQAYGIVDTVIAGRFLGETGLAALGATSDLIELTTSASWGIVVGLGMYTASLFGAKQYRDLKNNLYVTVFAVFGIMLALSLALFFFREPIYDLLRIKDAIRSEADAYFSVYILGFSLIVLNDFGLCTLNALGVSGYPFKMSLLSMALNIVGDILTVSVFDLGVLGLAIASILSALVVDIFYFFKIRKCLAEMQVLKGTPFTPSLHHLKKSALYSLPTGAQQLVMYAAAVLVLPLINGVGPAASAAYVVIMKIYTIVASVYQNSSKTVSNYVAQASGAGKFHLHPKGLRVGLIQALLFTTPFVALVAIFPRFFAGLFFPQGFEGEALEYAVMFATGCLPFILINIINNLFHSYFRGIAAARLLLLSTAVLSVARLILTYLFVGYGMRGVFLGWAGSWAVEAVFCILLYVFYIRKRYTRKCNL